ncbi:MAG: VOC family protein [Pseudomonadota bacterium]
MKLEHANVTVGSIDEAVRFLGAAFPHFRRRGGGHLHDDPDLGEWVHFGDDECYIALQQNVLHAGRVDIPYSNDGINHLGFVVESLDQLLLRLAELNYHPTEASVLDGHPHRRRAYIIDGNGFEWEFVEYTSKLAAERNAY